MSDSCVAVEAPAMKSCCWVGIDLSLDRCEIGLHYFSMTFIVVEVIPIGRKEESKTGFGLLGTAVIMDTFQNSGTHYKSGKH